MGASDAETSTYEFVSCDRCGSADHMDTGCPYSDEQLGLDES